jgi:hypothetical protein
MPSIVFLIALNVVLVLFWSFCCCYCCFAILRFGLKGLCLLGRCTLPLDLCPQSFLNVLFTSRISAQFLKIVYVNVLDHFSVFSWSSLSFLKRAVLNSSSESFLILVIMWSVSGDSFLKLFYYSYVHTRLGSFLPPPPPLPLPPTLPPPAPPYPLDTRQKLFCPYL